MKKQALFLFGILGLSLTGCHDDQNNQVVSQRYIHKYGYAVSKAEWDARQYPGQVITHRNDGVTVTETYENGVKHGPETRTFPHSQMVEHLALYNAGAVVKETFYNNMGLPVKETIQLSPTRHSQTAWYAEGSPMFVEEFVGAELLEGQYFTKTNDVESRVEKGHGTRLLRDQNGTLLVREQIEEGSPVKKETFYSSCTLESVVYLYHGNLHGEKRTFAMTGEPLAIEEWVNGQLHGKSTYFKNGSRYLEVSYLYGQKNGIERHFLDGEVVSQEIAWENDKKHGASVFYADNEATDQVWFYAGEQVSKRRFNELSSMDEMISHISSDVNFSNVR